MICQNQDNHLLYALKHGRFWFWDKHQNKWVPSDFAAQQYAKAQTKEPDLAQEDWLGRCFGILMDDYEVPDAVVKALRALSNKEEPPCKVNTTAPNADAAVTTAAPAATLAEETLTTQAGANSCPPDPCSPADASGAMSNPSGAAAACSAAEFDYSGLDAQTVTDLHLAEQMYTSGRKLAEMGLRRMADGVSIAHDALCVTIATKCRNGKGAFSDSEKTFGSWCESVGLNRKAAERLLQVAKLFDSSSPRQQQVLEELSPSLLYAAAKPSAPADLVQAVKSGDITTHKQYQELLKENQQLRADRVNALNAAAAAEAARDAALADVDGLHEQNRQLQAAATGAQESYRTAHKNEDSALRRATEAEQRAKEAEKQLAGARQVADAARMRADKYQREAEAAKAQPVAAAVDEDEINRRAHTLADELTAPLRSELEAAKAAAATPEQIELDTRNAYDSLLLAGRAMQNAWKSVKPQLAKLPPDTRAGAINQLTSTLTEIQTEAIKCL
jgi:mucin-associated surface protein (MASP), putative